MRAYDTASFQFSEPLQPPVRYTAGAQILHWLTAVLVIATLPIAWHMTMLARDNPTRDTWFTVHKSIGLTILALSVIRIVWRGLNPPPPLPDTTSRIESGLAHVSHWLLYLILFAMPISGYLISAAGGHPVNYFGLFTIPNVVPTNPSLAKGAAGLHVLGQWAVYALVLLHVIGTVWHLVMRRDDLLARMLPRQSHPI